MKNQEPTKWISVKDRLPDSDGELVLVSQNNNQHGDFKVLVLWYDLQCEMFRGWDDRQDTYPRDVFGEYNRVTHWQPLPEPPKD